jgi:hypothetical protein
MAGYATVWEFRVRADRRAEFERHYGPDGSWVALFRRGDGYEVPGALCAPRSRMRGAHDPLSGATRLRRHEIYRTDAAFCLAHHDDRVVEITMLVTAAAFYTAPG